MRSSQKSGTYTPRADEVDINKHSDRVNISGMSPREIAQEQLEAQRSVAESDKWLIARTANTNGRRKNSRTTLEKLGFKIIREANDLFYEVEAPEGWSKSTQGYWTKIEDADGTERLSQFFKGASYDRDAFVNVS